MKIVTVNVPESYIEAMNRLLDNKKHNNRGLYPSRSELIRVAVRAYLLRELGRATEVIKERAKEKAKKLTIKFSDDEKNFVHVPSDSINEEGEPIREFKTYKIVKRLDY